MKNKRKNFLLIFCALLAFFLLFLTNQTFAQDLEITDYPTIPGVDRPETIHTPLPTFLKYIYNLSIIIAGILSFVLIVWGGIKYITAGPRPAKLTDAREQITVAFVGIILIFASYIIVNTINPELTLLTISLPQSSFFGDIKPYEDDANIPELNLHEVPVGSIITSEYLVSSFLNNSTSTDINYASTTWPATTTPHGQYSTDFQGALYGARLKRIHEVASTSNAVAEKLNSLSEKLKKLIDECSCLKECSTNIFCPGGSCQCKGKLCPHKEEMEVKIEEIKLFTGAFEAFLNSNSLVEDYYNNNQLDIDALDDDEIKDLIQLMIEVENKGGYTPEIDPLERDIGQDLLEIAILLDSMKKIKRQLNPFDQERGYLSLMSFAESVSLEQEFNTIPNVFSFYVVFPAGSEKVDVKNDPATFYSASAMPFPYGPPATEPYTPSPEPDFLRNPQWPLMPKNIAWAAPPIPDPDPIDFDLDTPVATRSTCDYVVEIPIGRALDEAIKLTQRINNQLFNIFLSGHIEILSAKAIKLAAEQIKELDCTTACIQPICTPIPVGEVVIYICVPPFCLPAPILILWKGVATLALPIVNTSRDNIKESFKKLDSEEPIGIDYVCPDEFGNCRKDDGTLDVGRIEEKKYTLKEKLVTVQKLLNMSRETIDPEGETSVYEQLLEELVDLDLIHRRELSYFRKVDAIEKMDLQNCHIFYETLEEVEREEPTKEMLNCRDAETLYAIDHFDIEMCSPDPYLDANFFHATSSRARRPISCYCYNEDADQTFYNKQKFPELYATTINLSVPSSNIGTGSDNWSQMINSFKQGTMFQIGKFLGFGNNYYCCIKEHED